MVRGWSGDPYAVLQQKRPGADGGFLSVHSAKNTFPWRVGKPFRIDESEECIVSCFENGTRQRMLRITVRAGGNAQQSFALNSLCGVDGHDLGISKGEC